MNKLLTFMMIAIGVTSCASSHNEVASNSHALAQREIASASTCTLESHPRNKSWHRVIVSGEAYNQHWYSKKDAMNMKSKFEHKGRCH